MEKQKEWTVIELLNWTIEYLHSRGFSSPRTDAEVLLGHVLRYKRLDLYLHFDEAVPPAGLIQYRDIIKQRLSYTPVQYIIGETEFYSLRFEVTPSVLIPRHETEVLVERTLHQCKDRWANKEFIKFLDIGTGSGNIAISIAKNLPHALVDAVDVSPDALDVAKRNALWHNLGSHIQFHCGSIFEMNEASWHGLNAVVSNPPYISDEEFRKLPPEIRNYEPEQALCDGADGFRFYPEICKRSMQWLCHDGFLIFEVAMGGAMHVKEIMQDTGFRDIEVYKDLNAIDRVVCGWKRAYI